MESFKVSDFRLIARRDENFKAILNQMSYAAAKYALFAEKVGFSFFLEGCLQNAGASAADAARISQRDVEAFAGSVLLNCENVGNAAAFDESTANQMTRSLRRNHEHVNIRGRDNLLEMNVEAVGKCERGAFLQIRGDFVFVNVRLLLVRNENHRNIGSFNRVRNAENFQALTFSDGFGFGAFVQPDDDINAAVFQIQRVRMPLRTVTDNRDGLAVHDFPVDILVIISFCHSIPSLDGSRL